MILRVWGLKLHRRERHDQSTFLRSVVSKIVINPVGKIGKRNVGGEAKAS